VGGCFFLSGVVLGVRGGFCFLVGLVWGGWFVGFFYGDQRTGKPEDQEGNRHSLSKHFGVEGGREACVEFSPGGSDRDLMKKKKWLKGRGDP